MGLTEFENVFLLLLLFVFFVKNTFDLCNTFENSIQ